MNSLSSFAPSLNLLKSELNLSKKDANREVSENKINKKKIEKINEIKFDEVAFSYPNTKEKLFENLSLSMTKNNIYGIFGPSGSGKTTLLNLINGLIKPSYGSIKYNNINKN